MTKAPKTTKTTTAKPAKDTTARDLKAALKRIAELEQALADCRGDVVEHIRTDNGLTRHQMPLGAKHHNHTPSAVDAIRLFTWHAKAQGMERKDIIASLISQKFTPTTVRARVSRIFAGTDESCTSDAIRERLGLDEMELTEDDQVEDDEVTEDEEEGE